MYISRMSATPHPPEPHLPLTPAVFAILLALADGEKHGYAIMKEAALPSGGGVTLGPGTLYGAIDRMIRDGLIGETGYTDNDRRRYYRITLPGRSVLSAETARLSAALRSARSRSVMAEAGSKRVRA